MVLYETEYVNMHAPCVYPCIVKLVYDDDKRIPLVVVWRLMMHACFCDKLDFSLARSFYNITNY